MYIKFYILGIQDNFRGKQLYSLLESSGKNVEIFWGIDGRNFVFPSEFLDDKKSQFLYGRILSQPEIACTIGHKLIARRAFLDSVDLAVILEDDVEINNLDILHNRLKSLQNMKNPSIFFLVTHRRLSLLLFNIS